MCGIVGYNGHDKCLKYIISGLESLEYRGYDSAGVAYLLDGDIKIIKDQGRVSKLVEQIDFDTNSYLGIGHTRWATHGEPSVINAHPHKVGKITVVHNGIIENYQELKDELDDDFVSETDTEVISALINKLLKEKKDILEVLNSLKDYLVGSYALGIMVEGDNNLYAIRNSSPLIVGVSDKGNFIASDVPAILKYTKNYYLLDDFDYVKVTSDEVKFYHDGVEIEKKLLTFKYSLDAAEKNGYDHFMLKEIHEECKTIKDTMSEYLKIENINKKLKGLEEFTNIDIVGCGSAYHVGMVGKYLITKYSNINVNVEIASEYRYTKHNYSDKHLVLVISQSGETADTLAVLSDAKNKGIKTWAIVNVVGSSIARLADKVLYIKAGPEIAVATTKAYSCQLVMLSLMAAYLGIKNNLLEPSILKEYQEIPKILNTVISETDELEKIAKEIYNDGHIFYLGRKIDYALALEGSLKLKEISYIHSEAYAAGELKHGTISLIEDNTTVISIVTDDDIRLKTISNIKEVASRGAKNIIITDTDISDKNIYKYLIMVPKKIDLIESVYVVAKLQLLAYYVAKYKGCDIDKPRNLAKSVTVE